MAANQSGKQKEKPVTLSAKSTLKRGRRNKLSIKRDKRPGRRSKKRERRSMRLRNLESLMQIHLKRKLIFANS